MPAPLQPASEEKESGEIVEVTWETEAIPEESIDHQDVADEVESPTASITLSVTHLFTAPEDSVVDRFAIQGKDTGISI